MSQSIADKLAIGKTVVISGMADILNAEKDPKGIGLFVNMTATKAVPYLECKFGTIEKLKRFTLCHRFQPHFMLPEAGNTYQQISWETQYLLAERTDGQFLLLVPIYSKDMRFHFHGDDTGIVLHGETGDPHTQSTGGLAVFVALGKDPYKLCEQGAVSVMARMQTGKLRTEKDLPDFVDNFGWCTWDAFYSEVSHDKVRQGLESFRKGGVEPRMLILDDGWLSIEHCPSGEMRLTAFQANEKFGHTLKPTVKMAKEEFKIRQFLVWHAVVGYWGGVSKEKMPEYQVQDALRFFSKGILANLYHSNHDWWGSLVGLVPADQIARFYEDFHRLLESEGVDGIKVDNQGVLEGLAYNQGGRIKLTAAYRAGLEQSARCHFKGRLINCMSNAQETWYGSNDSNLIRSSTDFWPSDPKTHGLHLYTNAQVGVWFGQFLHPDWDMFQSNHPWGAYHAAGRAVSGSPLYVSDKVDGHDFILLRKLVLSDGTVLRCSNIGRPTRDCLCTNPTTDDVVLKVFNYNLDAGIIGAFNGRYEGEKKPVTVRGFISPIDVEGLRGASFACYAQQSKTLKKMARKVRAPITLKQGAWELYTLIPIDKGIAPIGLADKFNSAGAITAKGWNGKKEYSVSLRDGGAFIAWCEWKPASVSVNGNATKFKYNTTTKALTVSIPAEGKCDVVIAKE